GYQTMPISYPKMIRARCYGGCPVETGGPVRLRFVDRTGPNRTVGNTNIQRKLFKYAQKKEAEAVDQLRSFGIPSEELESLWLEQKAAELSPRAHASAHLKKELEKVLKLQTEIKQLEASIKTARASIKKMRFPPSDTLFYLAELEQTHTTLKKKAEQLYDSLNIPQNHPTLANVPLEYLHTLLLARDTKIAIRSKAIATFQEYAQIDQAVGGVQEALGTKAHQQTRQAITKRRPALLNLIRKYNQFCASLETSHRPEYKLPVPKPLPENLGSLRDAEMSGLWQDVWISNSCAPPRWLTDDKASKGIRALLTLQRCAEERVRLAKESKNLCSWFRDELYTLLALRQDCSFIKYQALLQLRIEDHLLLADQWSTPFVNKQAFQEQVAIVYQRLRLSQLALRALPTFAAPLPCTTNKDETSAMLSNLDEVGEESGREESECEDLDQGDVEKSEEPVEERWDAEVTGEALALADLQGSDMEDSDDEDGQLKLHWQLLETLSLDCMITASIRNWIFPKLQGGWESYRTVKSTSTARQGHKFRTPEFERLANPKALLDDDCVNGGALLLRETFGDADSDCAILSTFAIPKLLQTSSWTEDAWRITRSSEYWAKSTWLIPIHSRIMQHWALAVVKAKTRQVLLFDSLGSRSFLDEWLPKLQVVVTRLVEMA
ncbi:hypothetical protein V5O48_015401, partial [Marasmius crinis-equi]